MVSLEFMLYLTFSYLISCGGGIFTREFEFSLASSRQGQAPIVNYLSQYHSQIGASQTQK